MMWREFSNRRWVLVSKLVIRAAPDLKPAWVDPSQLGLAILNLALNARDAMPDGGRLQIACENRQTEAGNLPGDLAASDYVTIVSVGYRQRHDRGDLGAGFEPFFTTKQAGRGLWNGVIDGAGFRRAVGGNGADTSSLGKGTTIRYGCHGQGPGTANVSADPSDFVMEQRPARILVCDDDGDVLSVVGALLRDLWPYRMGSVQSHTCLADPRKRGSRRPSACRLRYARNGWPSRHRARENVSTWPQNVADDGVC